VKIPGEEWAQFYAQLAALEDAGVPISRALVTAVSQGPGSNLAKRVKKTNAAVSKGVDLADAGSKAKLFDALDASLVRAATGSGKLGPMLHRLAEFHRKRAEHIRTLKGQLLMPTLVLILAIFHRCCPRAAGPGLPQQPATAGTETGRHLGGLFPSGNNPVR